MKVDDDLIKTHIENIRSELVQYILDHVNIRREDVQNISDIFPPSAGIVAEIKIDQLIRDRANNIKAGIEIKTYNLDIIMVDDWGSFLFVNNALYKSNVSEYQFKHEIGSLIFNSNSPISIYLNNNKRMSIDSECLYSTFYDVPIGININDFMQCFRQ